METVSAVSFNLAGEELTVLSELLEAERARLLIEIRHTDHRTFRDELRHKLDVVERLIVHCQAG